MLILVLTLAFLFVCLVSSAAAFVSSVCSSIYSGKVHAYFRRSDPQWLAELMAGPRWQPRIALAMLREADNRDDQQVRLYADRARMWGWYSAFGWALAGISGLILALLDLASEI